MNVISNLSKVIRTLGVMGIMLALAGLAVSSAPSVSAARFSPKAETGTLTVHVDFATGDPETNVAAVTVSDQDGNIVAEATIDSETIFVTALAPGAYMVSIDAQAYTSHNEKVMITSDQTSSVSATLEAEKGFPAVRR